MRDSLAQTLNTDIMETIQKLDRIGSKEGGEAGDHHVAQVRVTDSGVCSDESEGSSSPQYRSWRSGPAGAPSQQRWSSPGNYARSPHQIPGLNTTFRILRVVSTNREQSQPWN